MWMKILLKQKALHGNIWFVSIFLVVHIAQGLYSAMIEMCFYDEMGIDQMTE